MKLGSLTVAYREENYLEKCMKQLKPFVDTKLVMISKKPWHGEDLPMDATPEIANQYGIGVVGDWRAEHEQRNAGLALLKDCDWVLIVDADEYYSYASLKNLKKFLETADKPAYGINTIYTYWKTPEYRIDPPESGGLIVAVRPNVSFNDKRGIDSDWELLPKNIVMHHWSYVRTDAEMLKKITTFEHQHEIVDGWYENVWKKWTPEMKNLHPVHPKTYGRAIKA